MPMISYAGATRLVYSQRGKRQKAIAGYLEIDAEVRLHNFLPSPLRSRCGRPGSTSPACRASEAGSY